MAVAIFLGALALLAPDVKAAADPLVSAVAAVRKAETAKLADPFAAPAPVKAFDGVAFSKTYKLGAGTRSGFITDDGYWIYKDGQLLLDLEPNNVPWHSIDKRPDYQVIKVSARRSVGKPFAGTNAYGAKAAVSVEYWEYDHIALLGAPIGVVSPYRRTVDASTPRTSYAIKQDLDGPAAKLIADNAAVQITGKIQPLSDGSLGKCSTNVDEATIQHPLEIHLSDCWVGVVVDRLAFIDQSTGKTLQEWRR